MHDLVVVGGGPVGLAAALHAAAAGLDVVVVEPRAGTGGGIDKACGEGLLPGALAEVLALGADPPGAALTGITYLDRTGRRASHDFRAGAGRGVRRTVLHAALAERAAAAGVPVVAARVRDLLQDGGRVQLALDGSAVLSARWVLGCDGLHSRVRRAAGLQVAEVAEVARRATGGRRGGGRRFGVRRHAAVAPWSSHVEVHWGGSAEGYVTPVGPREVGVAVLAGRGSTFADALEDLPLLAARLEGARWTSAERGAGPLRQRVRAVASGRVLLAGDAAGYVDALTGEGLRVGLAAARLAVGAVVGQRPRRVAEAYERAWRRETAVQRGLTAGLLAVSRTSTGRRALVPLAAASPPLFGAVAERLAR